MGITAEKDVLIVDDDEAVRLVISAALTRAGISWDTAVDGTTAIALLTTTEYSVVLLDLMMPTVDGAQVLESARSMRLLEGREPVIVVVTASPDRDLLQSLSEMVQVVFRKPFEIQRLVDLVQDCISARQRTSKERRRDTNAAAPGEEETRLRA